MPTSECRACSTSDEAAPVSHAVTDRVSRLVIVDSHPCKGSSTARFLRTEEVKALLRAAATDVRPIVLLLAQSGLRIEEALGLTVGPIDLRKRVIRVDRQRTQDGRITLPKSGRRRTVPLADGIEPVPVPLMGKRDPGEPLWLNSRGGPLVYQAFVDRWHKMLAGAGLGWSPTPHELRHFYASECLVINCPGHRLYVMGSVDCT